MARANTAPLAERAQQAQQARQGAPEAKPVRELVRAMVPEFQKAAPQGIDAGVLARDALTLLSATPKLNDVDPQSFLGALMTCASLGLRPGVGALGQAWVLPMKGKAQFILGYQGMVELAHRSGSIRSIRARKVHANDHLEVEYGLDERLVHRPPTTGERGEVIGYYAAYTLTNGGQGFTWWTREQMAEHRDRFAMARDRSGKIVGPWRDDFDAMALKTCVRDLFRFMPRSADVDRGMIADGTTRTDTTPEAHLEDVTQRPDAEVLQGELVEDAQTDDAGPTGGDWG